MPRLFYFLLWNLLFVSTTVFAGNLDPSGPPGPTMRPLDEVGTWSQVLPNEQRFKLVMNNEAVLDRETGLVWDRSPSTADYKWVEAMRSCYQLYKGGRRGWRPPTAEELSSFADSSSQLPKNAPFQINAQLGPWWSSTGGLTDPNQPFLYLDAFNIGDGQKNKTDTANVWCVRGPRGLGN